MNELIEVLKEIREILKESRDIARATRAHMEQLLSFCKEGADYLQKKAREEEGR